MAHLNLHYFFIQKGIAMTSCYALWNLIFSDRVKSWVFFPSTASHIASQHCHLWESNPPAAAVCRDFLVTPLEARVL